MPNNATYLMPLPDSLETVPPRRLVLNAASRSFQTGCSLTLRPEPLASKAISRASAAIVRVSFPLSPVSSECPK